MINSLSKHCIKRAGNERDNRLNTILSFITTFKATYSPPNLYPLNGKKNSLTRVDQGF
jgi:hypothetical protein